MSREIRLGTATTTVAAVALQSLSVAAAVSLSSFPHTSTNSNSNKHIRGVMRGLEAHYRPNVETEHRDDGSEYTSHTFSCLDGSRTGLPFRLVNDDYCDCFDGSDEPGTSACSGVVRDAVNHYMRFQCRDGGKAIFHAQVNDGICDCCDGSDEFARAAVQCDHTCHGEKILLRSPGGDVSGLSVPPISPTQQASSTLSNQQYVDIFDSIDTRQVELWSSASSTSHQQQRALLARDGTQLKFYPREVDATTVKLLSVDRWDRALAVIVSGGKKSQRELRVSVAPVEDPRTDFTIAPADQSTDATASSPLTNVAGWHLFSKKEQAWITTEGDTLLATQDASADKVTLYRSKDVARATIRKLAIPQMSGGMSSGWFSPQVNATGEEPVELSAEHNSTGLRAVVDDGLVVEGGFLSMRERQGDTSESFTVMDAGDGYIRLIPTSRSGEKEVALRFASLADGGAVSLAPVSDEHTRLEIHPHSHGYYLRHGAEPNSWLAYDPVSYRLRVADDSVTLSRYPRVNMRLKSICDAEALEEAEIEARRLMLDTAAAEEHAHAMRIKVRDFVVPVMVATGGGGVLSTLGLSSSQEVMTSAEPIELGAEHDRNLRAVVRSEEDATTVEGNKGGAVFMRERQVEDGDVAATENSFTVMDAGDGYIRLIPTSRSGEEVALRFASLADGGAVSLAPVSDEHTRLEFVESDADRRHVHLRGHGDVRSRLVMDPVDGSVMNADLSSLLPRVAVHLSTALPLLPRHSSQQRCEEISVSSTVHTQDSAAQEDATPAASAPQQDEASASASSGSFFYPLNLIWAESSHVPLQSESSQPSSSSSTLSNYQDLKSSNLQAKRKKTTRLVCSSDYASAGKQLNSKSESEKHMATNQEHIRARFQHAAPSSPLLRRGGFGTTTTTTEHNASFSSTTATATSSQQQATKMSKEAHLILEQARRDAEATRQRALLEVQQLVDLARAEREAHTIRLQADADAENIRLRYARPASDLLSHHSSSSSASAASAASYYHASSSSSSWNQKNDDDDDRKMGNDTVENDSTTVSDDVGSGSSSGWFGSLFGGSSTEDTENTTEIDATIPENAANAAASTEEGSDNQTKMITKTVVTTTHSFFWPLIGSTETTEEVEVEAEEENASSLAAAEAQKSGDVYDRTNRHAPRMSQQPLRRATNPEEIVANARREADRIRREALAERERLSAVREAEKAAERIRLEAEVEAHRLRSSLDDHSSDEGTGENVSASSEQEENSADCTATSSSWLPWSSSPSSCTNNESEEGQEDGDKSAVETELGGAAEKVVKGKGEAAEILAQAHRAAESARRRGAAELKRLEEVKRAKEEADALRLKAELEVSQMYESVVDVEEEEEENDAGDDNISASPAASVDDGGGDAGLLSYIWPFSSSSSDSEQQQTEASSSDAAVKESSSAVATTTENKSQKKKNKKKDLADLLLSKARLEAQEIRRRAAIELEQRETVRRAEVEATAIKRQAEEEAAVMLSGGATKKNETPTDETSQSVKEEEQTSSSSSGWFSWGGSNEEQEKPDDDITSSNKQDGDAEEETLHKSQIDTVIAKAKRDAEATRRKAQSEIRRIQALKQAEVEAAAIRRAAEEESRTLKQKELAAAAMAIRSGSSSSSKKKKNGSGDEDVDRVGDVTPMEPITKKEYMGELDEAELLIQQAKEEAEQMRLSVEKDRKRAEAVKVAKAEAELIRRKAEEEASKMRADLEAEVNSDQKDTDLQSTESSSGWFGWGGGGDQGDKHDQQQVEKEKDEAEEETERVIAQAKKDAAAIQARAAADIKRMEALAKAEEEAAQIRQAAALAAEEQRRLMSQQLLGRSQKFQKQNVTTTTTGKEADDADADKSSSSSSSASITSSLSTAQILMEKARKDAADLLKRTQLEVAEKQAVLKAEQEAALIRRTAAAEAAKLHAEATSKAEAVAAQIAAAAEEEEAAAAQRLSEEQQEKEEAIGHDTSYSYSGSRSNKIKTRQTPQEGQQQEATVSAEEKQEGQQQVDDSSSSEEETTGGEGLIDSALKKLFGKK